MKSAILFSGGKDSTMALNYAINNGDEVSYLLSIKSKNPDSYMFHVPNIDLTELIAEAIGIPLIVGYSDGVKEKELDDLYLKLVELKEKGVEALYTGALFSTYQKSRIETLCGKIGLKCFSPYWHMNPYEYMLEVLNSGFDVIICGVSAYGLGEEWLGKHLTMDSFKEFKEIADKYQIHLAFEGGEAETFVLDGPIFKKRIKILESNKLWDVDSGVFNILDAVLVDK